MNMEVGGIIALSIFGLLALTAISLIIQYFWDKWTSKLGAKEALKEEGITEQLGKNGAITKQMNQQTLDINSMKGSISSLQQSTQKDTSEIKNQLAILQNNMSKLSLPAR